MDFWCVPPYLLTGELLGQNYLVSFELHVYLNILAFLRFEFLDLMSSRKLSPLFLYLLFYEPLQC